MGHSTLYPLLYKLEAEGHIELERRSESGDRTRKYYAVTEAGQRVLQERQDEWSGLVEAMQKLGVT